MKLKQNNEIVTITFEGDSRNLSEHVRELNEFKSFSYRLEEFKNSCGLVTTITGTKSEIVEYGLKYFFAGDIDLAKEDEEFAELLEELEIKE